nr:hypothetical protein [Bacteroidota bacterium]
MTPIPNSWTLLEEIDDCFVFGHSTNMFEVYIDYDAAKKAKYTISYEQTDGDYELIDIEDGTFTTTAQTKEDAIEKAILLMQFIEEHVV